jgi:hypothetical protein
MGLAMESSEDGSDSGQIGRRAQFVELGMLLCLPDVIERCHAGHHGFQKRYTKLCQRRDVGKFLLEVQKEEEMRRKEGGEVKASAKISYSDVLVCKQSKMHI